MSDLQTNLDKLQPILARLRDTGVMNRIDGQDCPAR